MLIFEQSIFNTNLMCGLVYIYFDSLGTVLEINIDDDKDTQLYMEYIRNANHISHEVCKDSQQ